MSGSCGGTDTRARREGVIVFAVVLFCCAYFVPRGISWNSDTHLFLTASIVDRHRLNIDPFAHVTGDIAYANGHYYADKAPGLSLLAVPIYLLVKATLLGGHPLTSVMRGPPAAWGDFLPRYVLALLLAGVPTGLLAALLCALLARMGVGWRWRVGLALTYGLGTLARPFGGELFSHQLAALFVFAAGYLLLRLRRGELGTRAAVGAGLLLGMAVITEYPTALLAVLLALYTLATPARWRRLGALALGALPPALVGAAYNIAAFGGPLSVGYAHLAGPSAFQIGQARGFFGITAPHFDALWETTFGPYRGLFFFAPVLALAIPGFWRLLARATWRAEALLWLALVLVYGLMSVSYFAWNGGYSMGPRQFLPALPYLIPPIGELVRRPAARWWRPLCVALAALSVALVEAATAVGPLFDPRYDAPLRQIVLPRLVAGQLDNNWGMVFGLVGLWQLLPLGGLGVGVLLWLWRGDGSYGSMLPAIRSVALIKDAGRRWVGALGRSHG